MLVEEAIVKMYGSKEAFDRAVHNELRDAVETHLGMTFTLSSSHTQAHPV